MGTGIDQRVVLKCFKSIELVKSVSHKEEWLEAIFEEVCRIEEFLQRLQIVVLDAVWPNTGIKNTFLSHDSYDLTIVRFLLQHPENTWWFKNSWIVEILLLHEIYNHVFSSIVKDVLQTFHSFVATDKFLQHLQRRFFRSMTDEKISAHDGSRIVVKLSTLREVKFEGFYLSAHAWQSDIFKLKLIQIFHWKTAFRDLWYELQANCIFTSVSDCNFAAVDLVDQKLLHLLHSFELGFLFVIPILVLRVIKFLADDYVHFKLLCVLFFDSFAHYQESRFWF